MSDTERRQTEGEESNSPPILRTWPRLYAFVLGELALLILLFHLFSLVYR